jgi:hypothetical protein
MIGRIQSGRIYISRKGEKVMSALRRILGILLILAGIGMFVGNEVMMYLYPPIETDVVSIRRNRVPVGKTVIVSGRVSRYGTVRDYDERTGKTADLSSVYELGVEQDGQEWSVKVMTDGALPEGEVVVVEGTLKANVHDVPGYLIEVNDAPPMRLLCLATSGTVILAGVALTMGRRKRIVRRR